MKIHRRVATGIKCINQMSQKRIVDTFFNVDTEVSSRDILEANFASFAKTSYSSTEISAVATSINDARVHIRSQTLRGAISS